ncbi:hypothetical protein F183_A53630 [Bryobacterales bacterium F-183]|nr:hypothetical protein F183_A53630 [Bryobacterales bacterium F-183]
MSQLGDAITRFHRLLESDAFKDLAWAEELQERMKQEQLLLGTRPASPVLRPHFITKRQYENMVKAAESLYSALHRVQELALGSQTLMNRMQLLPAEKMLAAIDPGYPFLSVTELLDVSLNNGSLRFTDYNAETPAGIAYSEALSNLFYDAPPVKEFRKRYSLTKIGGGKFLMQSLLKAYKEFGSKNKKPNIAILEFRQPFQREASPENVALAEMFRKEGCQAEVVAPEHLEYKNGQLRKGEFVIELIYRKMKVHEFLVRFDLGHPLVRAYRDKAVCMVNSFRAELAQKKAIFDLLTDETITASFPLAERKAIREFVPWTRVVRQAQTTHKGSPIDLLEFIRENRETLILKPNDDAAETPVYIGSKTDEAGWEKAIKLALRNPYVVQEVTEAATAPFPVLQYGTVQMKELNVGVHPHSSLGKVHGASSWLTSETSSGFVSAVGVAPTFILDSK